MISGADTKNVMIYNDATMIYIYIYIYIINKQIDADDN